MGIETTFHPIADELYRLVVNHKRYSLLTSENRQKGNNLTHMAYFGHYNAGDSLIPVMLRDLFDQQIGQNKWHKRPLDSLVNSDVVKSINQRQALIIGGGGLFLKDTNRNQLSGWQWSCDLENLRKIEVPIILFAVGYNRFRGQEDFDPIFSRHLQILIEKAQFVGIREYGSIEKIKKYLPSELHGKLKYQPCMTTLASRLYGKQVRDQSTPRFISLNCAFDRTRMRFGDHMGEKLAALARVMKQVSQLIPIRYYAHHETDEYFLPFLDAAGVDYTLIRLYRQPPKVVLDAYCLPVMAIGMRGHAQMIPFGCNRPILSIITHNKLQYFLEDIQCSDCGIDIEDSAFEEKLIVIFQKILNNIEFYEARIKEQQRLLWKVTLNNFTELR
ncbi:MAG: polysaccharide pyruvyl transferase family protein, partial [Saprospiraceae bacterium]|nr:polysaccharide pyruvyl transferase family protein [Saprospiraceae bacterium]